MYNGIGLTTPRGSGTSGYVVRNLSTLRHHDNNDRQASWEAAPPKHREPDEAILEHERKRNVEVKCMELRVALEDQDIPEEEIEKQVDILREKLLANLNALAARNSKPTDTHAMAAAKKQELSKLARAFGTRSDYQEGDAFNREKQDEIRQKRVAERAERDEHAPRRPDHRERIAEQNFRRAEEQRDRERRRREDDARRAAMGPPPPRNRGDDRPSDSGYRRRSRSPRRNMSPPPAPRSKRDRSRSRSPPPPPRNRRRVDSRSRSRSRSPYRSPSRSRSRSPARGYGGRRRRSPSRSASPRARGRPASRTPSRSPTRSPGRRRSPPRRTNDRERSPAPAGKQRSRSASTGSSMSVSTKSGSRSRSPSRGGD